MNLQSLLKARILKDPNKNLGDFLRAQIPPFVAPTDAAAWRRKIPRLRREALARVYLRGIPRSVVNAKPRVVWGEVLRPDRSYVIRKLRYEAYPDYWIPALLYEPTRLRGKVPVVLNPNGHHHGGKAAEYKQARCANIARRGMIALSIEFIGMSELEADWDHNKIAHLELTGLAGAGLFYLPLKKGLDVLLAHRHADSKRVGVTGLSGGGWQTIVISALDPRVPLSVPVAGYTALRAAIDDLRDLACKEQSPTDLLTVADYDTMTAMLASRPALLILNENDVCYRTDRVRPVIYDAVKPTYAAMGKADNLQTYSNKVPGTHNYQADNRSQFYRFVRRHFELSPDTPDRDIHRHDELYTERELNVGLPPVQRTLMGLARERADQLARSHRAPRTAAQRRSLRQRLIEVIRLPRYDARATMLRHLPGKEAAQFALRTGSWTLPLMCQAGQRGQLPVLTINKDGRAVPMPLPIADPGPRYHLEILGTGELRTDPRRLMLIDAAGQRLLGIQVAQVLAAAAWIARRERSRQVHMVGDGWGYSFALLLAAALQPRLFASYTDYGPVLTLRYLMEWPFKFEEAPSCFCFGLMEVADVPQIKALLTGVEYRQPGREVLTERLIE